MCDSFLHHTQQSMQLQIKLRVGGSFCKKQLMESQFELEQ